MFCYFRFIFNAESDVENKEKGHQGVDYKTRSAWSKTAAVKTERLQDCKRVYAK